MLISAAYAASGTAAAAPGAPDFMGTMSAQLMMVLVLVILFYVLLIMPQQRRFKEHSTMLKGLKKGDKILTSGGLLATVDHMVDDKDEVVIDLGNNIKVTALRSTIQTRIEDKPKDAKKTV